MASPSHFQFHPVTVRVAAAGAMLIREDRTHHDIRLPGTDRYIPTLVYKWQVSHFWQIAKEMTSRNEVANPETLQINPWPSHGSRHGGVARSCQC